MGSYGVSPPDIEFFKRVFMGLRWTCNMERDTLFNWFATLSPTNIDDGTVNNQTIRWNAADSTWKPSSNILNDDTGLGLGGAIVANRRASVYGTGTDASTTTYGLSVRNQTREWLAMRDDQKMWLLGKVINGDNVTVGTDPVSTSTRVQLMKSTVTDADGWANAMQYEQVVTGSTASQAKSIRMIQSQVYDDTTGNWTNTNNTSGYQTGIMSEMFSRGTAGTKTLKINYFAYSRGNTGANTVTNWHGFRHVAQATNNSVITNCIGHSFEVEASATGGSVTNSYAFKAGPSGATNKWDFYSDNNHLSYIQGDTKIGNVGGAGTTPGAKLHVDGTFRVDQATTAPATGAYAAPTNFFGTDITNVLGTPSNWVLVNVGGTNYKLPCYAV